MKVSNVYLICRKRRKDSIQLKYDGLSIVCLACGTVTIGAMSR